MKKALTIFLFSLIAAAACAQKVETYSVEVVNKYPHDIHAYTQGLFWHNGKLYESTGVYGHSSIRETELGTGKVLRSRKLSKKYFGEGSVILNDRLYLLTWKNRTLFEYDPESFEMVAAFSYPKEGWGLATDGKSLIASDGTDALYFLSPDLKLERSIKVTLKGRPVKYLNELEWIDGKIWANIYTTDLIAIINPSNGKVEAMVDCTGLLPDKSRTPDTDVLNGIATKDGRIFLTGKNWPYIYEVRLK